jgi:hypothetical protein
MPERRIAKLERLIVDGPGKDRWFIRPGTRKGPWIWFDPEEVPFVDATEAQFELERVRGGWKVLHQVDAEPPRPSPERELVEGESWPRSPRTLGECRAASMCQFFIGCSCGGGSRWERPSDHCRAFDDWTVEALQRIGYWRCRCGRISSAMIYDWGSGMRLMVERWALDGSTLGWVRG